MRARALMVLGTASNAGKSITVAALCRIFADRGVNVVPFKAQNMSLNAAVTPDGREIGRAQAVQAEAARRPAEVEMNPVLLKPSSDRRSQVILEGVIWDDVDAWDYHRRRTAELFPRIVAAYERLAARCDLVILEGAGSPAEINLKDRDVVNLRMAQAADAPCLLVADIDRGGAFAALAGTLALLEPHERERIAAFAITKFRGDRDLLTPGIVEMERRLGIPCAGVVPWIPNLGIDEEDGYALPPTLRAWPDENGPARRLRVAVIDAPFFANETDADALAAEPSVVVRRIATPDGLFAADVVVIPGSKETAADLRWIREHNIDRAILAHAAAGRPTIGICGGMQMLGHRIDDPHGIESGGTIEGLGLLPLTTTLASRKTTRRVHGEVSAPHLFGQPLTHTTFDGYEIHVGISQREEAASTPFALLCAAPPFDKLRMTGGRRLFATDARRSELITRHPELVEGRRGTTETWPDGAISAGGNVVGTYVHGLFDDDACRHAAVDAMRAAAGLAPAVERSAWRAEREGRYDRLASVYAQSLDVDLLTRLAGLGASAKPAPLRT